ncbi:MAG: NMD3-related protein [Candidatus Hodarchaeales archaeon]
MNIQCISCGKEEVFCEHLCQECFLEANPLVKNKQKLKLVSCLHCELISLGGHWTNSYLVDIGSQKTNNLISDYLQKEWIFNYKINNISVSNIELALDDDRKPINLKGIIEIEGRPDPFVPFLKLKEDFEIIIEWGECSECRSRMTGNYISKIQVRTQKPTPESQLKIWASEIEALSATFPLTDGKNPLFKIVYLKNGIDALFQTKAPANSVGRLFARKHGGIVTVTTEFAGFDKSKWKEFPRKPVVLVTLPFFSKGDFLQIESKLIQIISINEGKVEFWDFTKKILNKLPIKTFTDLKPVMLSSFKSKFQLINFEENDTLAHIMDLNNFQTFYIESFYVSDISEGEEFLGTIIDDQIFRSNINWIKQLKTEMDVN